MLKFVRIKNKSDIRCRFCNNLADRLMVFDTKNDGRINVFICESCFNKLSTDFKKGNVKEIIENGIKNA